MGASQSKKYIVAADDTSTVLVRRNEATYYGSLLSIIHEYYPHIPVEAMVIQTNELPVCNGRYVDIPGRLWSEVSPRVNNIRVIPRPPRMVRKEPGPEYRCFPAYGHQVLAGKPVIYLFTPSQ